MTEYIKREDALKAFPKAEANIFENCRYCTCLDSDQINEILNSIPAANVVERKKGQWIWDDDGMDWGIGAWRCSSCKARSPMWWNTERTNPRNKSGHCFCPNCGAEMEIG